MAIDYIAIGHRIKCAREKRGMSQEQLSSIIDLSVQHISNIENGHTIGSISAMINIANALGTTVDDFFYDNVTASYEAYDKDFKELLEDCSVKERRIVYESARQLIKSIRES